MKLKGTTWAKGVMRAVQPPATQLLDAVPEQLRGVEAGVGHAIFDDVTLHSIPLKDSHGQGVAGYRTKLHIFQEHRASPALSAGSVSCLYSAALPAIIRTTGV